jgi:predicted transcriptional regulator
MHLVDYIKEMGVSKTAKLLDVTQPCVSGWLAQNRLPADYLKMQIVKKTNGLVTYADIIEPYFSKTKNKSKSRRRRH